MKRKSNFIINNDINNSNMNKIKNNNMNNNDYNRYIICKKNTLTCSPFGNRARCWSPMTIDFSDDFLRSPRKEIPILRSPLPLSWTVTRGLECKWVCRSNQPIPERRFNDVTMSMLINKTSCRQQQQQHHHKQQQQIDVNWRIYGLGRYRDFLINNGNILDNNSFELYILIVFKHLQYQQTTITTSVTTSLTISYYKKICNKNIFWFNRNVCFCSYQFVWEILHSFHHSRV